MILLSQLKELGHHHKALGHMMLMMSEIEDKMIEDPRDSSHDLSLNNILQSFKTTTQPTTYGKQE